LKVEDDQACGVAADITHSQQSRRSFTACALNQKGVGLRHTQAISWLREYEVLRTLLYKVCNVLKLFERAHTHRICVETVEESWVLTGLSLNQPL